MVLRFYKQPGAFQIFAGWWEHPYIGFTVYFIVSAIWLVPDKRIEKVPGK